MSPREDDDALLDAAPAGIWVADRAGRILSVNAAAAELLGVPPGELVGRASRELAHPADAANLARLTSARAGEVVTARVRLRRRDGSWALVEGRARALVDGRVVVVAHDITELDRTERALAASEREFGGIFELALSGKASADPATGRLLRVNRKLCEITGYSADELLQRPEAEITHPDDRAADAEAVRRVLAGEASGWTHEKRYVRKDGGITWAIVTGTILRDEAGTPRAFATIHDITDRKRMEAALREADRRKDEFLALLSHELRNPLAPMRSSLAVLARAAPASVESERARAVLERQVGHLARLVDDLLDLARITRGAIQLRRERVDLAGIVVSTAEDHRAVLAAAGVTLVVRVPGEGAAVDGDPTRLAQVLGNLLHNAGKFTPRGGRVEVVLDAARSGVVTLRVRDTGFGIDPAVLPRLFEPFSLGDLGLDRTRGGLGLGLALVKRLVELHGGTVSAHSDGPGEGAEFEIVLPVLPREEASAPEPRPPSARNDPEDRRRVLVVDDNVDAAETLRDILEMAGHVAAVAHDGKSAVALARAFAPDAVLCDIGLPGMDGYAVARALRREAALAEVFLVALTGYALPDDVRRAAEAGFDAHVAKPPPLESIEALLRRAPRAAAPTCAG